MEDIKVEYLVILKNQGSFCNSIKSFNNLLKAHGDIQINGNKLKYKDFEVDYIIKTGSIQDKEQRFFDIQLCSSKKNIEDFTTLLKVLREIIYKSGGNINIVWDEISHLYSIKSYPTINRIENLLRKLITKFMLTSVGLEWEQETLPDDVKNVISKTKRPKNSYVNILHETDFVHLADFLFKPYAKKNSDELFKLLKSNADKNLSDFSDYIPKSNWERYFTSIIECEDGFLNKQWRRLYELRCLVAHNNFITINEYDEIVTLSNELEKTFTQAINNLDKIKIDVNDKDVLLESVVRTKNELYGEFLNLWKIIESEIRLLTLSFRLENQEKIFEFRRQLNTLLENNIIDNSSFKRLFYLYSIRNRIVHSPDLELTKLEFSEINEMLQNAIIELRNANSNKTKRSVELT